jgi:hypothetical protein
LAALKYEPTREKLEILRFHYNPHSWGREKEKEREREREREREIHGKELGFLDLTL